MPHEPRSPADPRAPYRPTDRDAVAHAAVLAPHREGTRLAMCGHPGVVLVVHDFTESDYTGLTPIRDLGRIGNGPGRGYECPNGLAVDPDTRQASGPANQRGATGRRPTTAGRASGDHPPGWLVLWRGWQQLQVMPEGAPALGLLRSG